MGLRVGVVTGSNDAGAGGAWTFTATLVEALKAAQSPHTFIMLDDLLAQMLQDELLAQILQAELLERAAKERGLLKRTADLAAGLAGKVVGHGSRPAVDPPPQNDDRNDRLETLVRNERIDILWFMTPLGEPLPIPYIATVWDLEHRKQPYFPEVSTTGWTWNARESTYSTLLPSASMIITGTNAGKEEVVHYYRVNPANVAVIPLPVPAGALEIRSLGSAEIKKKYRLNGDLLLYPAQFWPHKNHVNLLRALRILRNQSGLDLSLVLTGSDKGNQNHVMKQAFELGLSDRVFVLGFVPRDDLNSLYRASMALAFPSYFGPDNIPPLEAFALGCPVIAANVPGVEEQIGEAALLFDPSNPSDIAATIQSVCQNPQLRAQLISKGNEIAKVRTPQAYIATLCSYLYKFDAIRRCWGASYQHS